MKDLFEIACHAAKPKEPFENLNNLMADSKKKLAEAKRFADRQKCERFFYANCEKLDHGFHWSTQLNDKWEKIETKIRDATREEPEEYSIYLKADVCMIIGFDDSGHAIDEEEEFLSMTLREYLCQYGYGNIKDLELANVIVNEGFESRLNHVWNQKVKFGMKVFIPSEEF
jgi:hypothetical protein